MAETPEIPAVPAEAPPAEAAANHPDPSEETLGGAEQAEMTNQSSWVDSGSPAVVGSYGTPAPSAAAEAPAPEAAPAVFVAGYGSAPADLLPEQPAPEAAPAVFVAGYGSAAADLLPEQPAPEAAPAVFVAGYGSAPADLLPEQPAPEAAPAVFVAGYGSAPADLLPEQPAPEAAPAVFVAGYGSAPADLLPEQPAPEAAPAVFVAGYGSAPLEPPGIATSIVVPPLPAGEAGEGGEWDLLRSKVGTWFDGADLQGRWESLGGPLRAAGLLLAAVVLLRLYSALLETLGDLPLVPRLLQLVGLLSVARFALTKLVRSSERERILTSWNQRWNDFRGRD
ncbi:CAAD domain-containing protein [Vulcanococcus limneticus]|uniref:CAAD domain-containing protein n=1 Tax=Vulcanococcus limneticus TaxID=2170428 RepID=UPI00398BF57C